MSASNNQNLHILVAPPQDGGQYQITTGYPNLHHVHHVLFACEKRLSDCDAADAQNPYPQNPHKHGDDASFIERHLSDQWQPSEQELAVYFGKRALIDDRRTTALIKRKHALALLRQATDPLLLQDDIFKDFDLEKAWAATFPPPPAVTRQPAVFVPSQGRGPPMGMASPPAPDKVELMNAHYAEQQSLLANPLPQPGPYAV